MSLLRVPIYPTRNLAVEIDPGARSIVAGTNVTFTTNADDSITINASGGVGTVTSVGATGSTGLTIGGSPITTSGTLTFTLSANLQSWSGIAPSSKADTSALGSYVLKAGDMMTGGLAFGSATGSSNSDVTRHIALYGTSYGLGITGNRLNYVAPINARHTFVVNGVDSVSVGAANTSDTLLVPGSLRSTGSGAILHTYDRTSSRQWGWYGTGDVFRLWNGSGDIMTVSPSGNVTTSGYVHSQPTSVTPSNYTTFGFRTTGSFGGGVALVDGGTVGGIWMSTGPSRMILGLNNGSSGASLTGHIVIDTSGNVTTAGYIWPTSGGAGTKKLTQILVSNSAPGALADGTLYLRY